MAGRSYPRPETSERYAPWPPGDEPHLNRLPPAEAEFQELVEHPVLSTNHLVTRVATCSRSPPGPAGHLTARQRRRVTPLRTVQDRRDVRTTRSASSAMKPARMRPGHPKTTEITPKHRVRNRRLYGDTRGRRHAGSTRGAERRQSQSAVRRPAVVVAPIHQTRDRGLVHRHVRLRHRPAPRPVHPRSTESSMDRLRHHCRGCPLLDPGARQRERAQRLASCHAPLAARARALAPATQ